MADGTTKPIADIEIGDTVVATDPETGVTTAAAVTHLHLNQDENLVDLTITHDNGPPGTIKTTDDHRFWSETRQQWIDAGEIAVGEEFASTASGNATVTSVRHHSGIKSMHDLTIAAIHTYYVLAGSTPVLVHNNDGFPGTLWTGGDFPVGGAVDAGGPANGVLYRTQNGVVSNYAVYGPDSVIRYRVDLVGASHGGVDTPHYQPYEVNTNPKTGAKYPKPTGEAFSGYGPNGTPRLGC